MSAALPRTPIEVWVGLGSNQGDARTHLQTALTGLKTLAVRGHVRCSPLYRSPPVGPQDQPDFLNAVTVFEARLDPWALLDALHRLELDGGRIRTRRWGPRTLDLDVLLYGDRCINDERLQVPHPGMTERMFVLRPMADLDPGRVVPGHGRVETLLAACPPLRLEAVPWSG